MPPSSARELMFGLQITLATCNVDYEQAIKGLGQVSSSEERALGRVFTFTGHLRGLLLSQLSNQREWKPISQNLDRLRAIFLDYDQMLCSWPIRHDSKRKFVPYVAAIEQSEVR